MAFSLFKKREDTFDYDLVRSCKNCGQSFQGRFCGRCGEKVVDERDRSFATMAESLLNAFTFLEGKFWRSFALIVSNPGKLTDQIKNGIQVPYMKVVGLFFVANFFYFLFPVFDTFNSSLYSQYNFQEYSPLVQTMVKEALAARELTIDEFTIRYNAQSGNLAKLLLVILVFIFILPLSIINYSRSNRFFDHLQLSYEFHAYQILIICVIVPNLIKWIIVSAKAFAGFDWEFLLSEEVYSNLSLLLFFYFFVRAQHTYYRHGWVVSVLKGSVLVYLVFLSWQLYRFILFLITYYTL